MTKPQATTLINVGVVVWFQIIRKQIETQAFFLERATDSTRYHEIIATGARYPKASIGIETIRNIYLVLLLFQLKFLNFIENIGISEIRKYENKNINANNNAQACSIPINHSRPPTINDDQNSALAGVGKPINEVV